MREGSYEAKAEDEAQPKLKFKLHACEVLLTLSRPAASISVMRIARISSLLDEGLAMCTSQETCRCKTHSPNPMPNSKPNPNLKCTLRVKPNYKPSYVN